VNTAIATAAAAENAGIQPAEVEPATQASLFGISALAGPRSARKWGRCRAFWAAKQIPELRIFLSRFMPINSTEEI